MSEVTVDVTDDTNGVEKMIYNKQDKERSPWKFCNSVTLPRSEVVFFTQATILLLIVITCCIKLAIGNVSCENMPYWTSLLAWVVGYILPNPRP